MTNTLPFRSLPQDIQAPDASSTGQPAPDPGGSGLAGVAPEVLAVHHHGKLETTLRYPLTTMRDLSLTYTPGVAQVSSAIHQDQAVAQEYTWAHRLVAVISDGTAVLGLGDIGPRAALPVMEGKSALFKTFAGLDSVPIVLDTKDTDEIVQTIARMAPSFGAINLEDISAPRCFEIEQQLTQKLNIPVMHDDQHGTAVVVLAGLENAAKVIGRDLTSLKVAVIGAGAAGVACSRILLSAGVRNIVVCDSQGILSTERELTGHKLDLALLTNPEGRSGGLAEAIAGADVLIGLSGGQIDPELIKTMGPAPIVFALANPTPEIDPATALRYAAVVATGRSDYPNQINNVLAFPGIFRGALDAGATRITEEMKLAASRAIASAVPTISATCIIPGAFEPQLADRVAAAVAAAALW